MKHWGCVRLAGHVVALALAACGGAPAPAASGPASVAQATTAKVDAPAAAGSASREPAATTRRQRLKAAPYSIALPAGATIEKDDGPVASDTVKLEGSGVPLTIGPRGPVGFMPLDNTLRDLARQKMKVVFKEGSAESYAIAYQPSPTRGNLQYVRYFTIDGKNMQCEAGGILETSIPEYDAVCKSISR